MYKKEDVINLRHSDYEITPVDTLIYEKYGYVLHQGYQDEVVYKPHFGSILNQRIITVDRGGKITVEEWYINRYDDKDVDFYTPTATEMEIGKLKLAEMLEVHSNDQD